MSPCSSETSLITGGFTIIGVLIGGFIGYYFSTRLINRQDFNKAAAEFRSAFTVQFNLLKYNVKSGSGDASDVGEYLRTHHGNHLKAFETFKYYLPPRVIEAIDKAWAEYCNFKQYSDKNNQEAMRKLALKNLEGVLKFAKHK